MALVAAMVALVACVLVDTAGGAHPVLVPILMLAAVLCVAAAAHGALRRAR
jgi:hypothetical protein